MLLILPGLRAPAAVERQVLHGQVTAAATHLQPVGRMAGANRLDLAIGLPLRDPQRLGKFLQQIQDPSSPNYRHYLTPAQFTERFGPTQADYQAVMAFADANGLTVRAMHPNRLLLDVNGSVADIERALHVTLRVYQHPTEKRTFHAPDAEPSLDLAAPVLSISGLDDFSQPRPLLHATALTNGSTALPQSGSGPGGTYMGNDFRAAYAPGVTLDGTGQRVGLLEFDTYTPRDIAYYENQAGLPSVTLSNVFIDDASTVPGSGAVEVSLDIEAAIAMASGLSEVIIYTAPNYPGFTYWLDMLNRMASDDLAGQLSCSWYATDLGSNAAADQIFQQMAAQGQSFFNASGDEDAYTGLIPFPEDSPWITQVGGTTLTTSGPGGTWVAETVWNQGGGIGSGGGISTQYPIPSWQENINMTANQGSSTMRNTPDVALTADNVYVRANGEDQDVGGTSCAAPLWAGFAALANQQAAASGLPPVGFVNPVVGTIGTEADYTSAFHDITTGNNTNFDSPTQFFAVPSYDLCTGWGTPAGQILINTLVNPDALVITPVLGFTFVGGPGGPFPVSSNSLSLTNVGTNSLAWTLVNTSSWLNASPSGGTLTSGAPAANVTVSLNATASTLTVGTYVATLWFTNLNDNVVQSRQYTLSVVSPPVITMQPVDEAVLEGASATFTVEATGGLPLYYQWQASGTNLVDGGNISGATNCTLTVVSVSSNDLGTYSVIVSNAGGLAISSNALLSIVPSAPVITLQPASQAVGTGSTAVITVGVVGSTPLSYQWEFDGTNISDATNSELTLAGVQVDQAGSYAVTIGNSLGSVTSSAAVLTVGLPPAILTQPGSLIVAKGQPASFSVSVSGTAPLSCQWQQNGTNLSDSRNISGSATATLLIRRTTTGSAGVYALIVTNFWGSATCSEAALAVVSPPTPFNQTVWVGDSATINVAVSGPGHFTYQWQLNGANLPNGFITNVVANDLEYPMGLAVDAFDDLFIADEEKALILEAYPNGIITNLAGVAAPCGVAVDTSGDVFFTATLADRINEVTPGGIVKTVAGKGYGYTGDGGPATNATLHVPCGVAVDASGNLFIADTQNNVIREVYTNGIITTVAGNYGIGNPGYAGDGGPATNAFLNTPYCLALDASGNLFIADTENNVIRKVDTNGIITTVAGSYGDGTGAYSGDGGPATNARMNGPDGVTVDMFGNLFIGDTRNNVVRKVDSTGCISTVAGNGIQGYSGNGGAATNASMYSPAGVAVDSSGNLYIADSHNNLVREVMLSASYPTLTLSDVTTSNAGTYALIITSPYGSFTNTEATITAVSSPVIAGIISNPDGSVTLNLLTPPGSNSFVLAAANLEPPVSWQPITTNVAGPSAAWQFTDTNALYYPSRFYRTLTP